MKLKPTFELIDLDEESIAVPVGAHSEDVQGIIKLNHEGVEIFHLLQEEVTEDGIVEFLSQKYDNDRSQISNYVSRFIKGLRKLNLIDE